MALATTQIDGQAGIHVKGGQTDVAVSDATAARILDSLDAFGADLRDHPVHAGVIGFIFFVVIIFGFYYLSTRQRLKHELEKYKINHKYKEKIETRRYKGERSTGEADQ